MTELSRSLLAAAREGLAPDAAVAARVRAKVASAVGASAVGATAGSAAAVGAAGSAAGATAGSAAVGATTGAAVAIPIKAGLSSAALLKLGAALLVVGAVTTAAIVSDNDRTPAYAPAPSPPTLASPDTDEVRTDIRVVAPNDPLAAPAPQRARAKHAESRPGHAAHAHAASAAHDSAAASETASASSAQPAPAPARAATPQPATLSREVELIDLAMVSLRRNAPLVALEAIRVFERETLGEGQMAEEAAAIEIEARCKLREDVTGALARFDREWPNSAQRARIQTACFAKR
ncbi:MAG TPA: hypothetical protein VIV11_27820 [Kofleriaceae bacterium]